MKPEYRKIMIVGGGLAGLACAKHLCENGETDFLVVTEDVGGRASSSQDKINFGSFYARTDYRHIWPYITIRRPFRIFAGYLIDAKGRHHTAWSSVIRHPLACLRFALHLSRFDRHLQQLMRRAEKMSLKRAIEKDPYILKLYRQSATNYLEEHDLTQIRDHLVAPVLRGHTFMDLNRIPAIIMFRAWMAARRRAYECSFDANKLVSPFKDKITVGTVLSVDRIDAGWAVTTSTGQTYVSSTLVMATPVNVTKELVGEPLEHNASNPIYMALIDGEVRNPFGRRTYTILPLTQPDVAIVKYDDGTYLFASNREDYDLSEYFQSYNVIESKCWNAALFIGSKLVEAKRNDKLYLIGDFVLGGMEMAYLTGKWAAGDIRQQNQARHLTTEAELSV